MKREEAGWKRLVREKTWQLGDGHYPLPAYSEFMPAPRVGLSVYGGEIDPMLFSNKDAYGWRISELEEEYELKPGLQRIAGRLLEHLMRLGRDAHTYSIAGHGERNLNDNPYWSPELASHLANRPPERYVVLLPLALSKTQDDLGRVRWTLFGASEQGPERAFWKSFYSAPERERPQGEGISFITRLLREAYGERVDDRAGLDRVGFRILPTRPNPRLPYWQEPRLPTWTRRYLIEEQSSFDDVRYLLTFRPFTELPQSVRERYFAKSLQLLPFPGSLVFWGMAAYTQPQAQLPLAVQLPLLRLVPRHDASGGLRVPQSGWLREPHGDASLEEIEEELLVNSYRRTHRWQRMRRDQDPAAESKREERVARALFSTESDDLDLYNKPMARNAQVWTRDAELLLNGPLATRTEIEQAAKAILEGGIFRYRFTFPAMRVNNYEVYWQRPLVAWAGPEREAIQVMDDAPLGYMTAYPFDAPDPAEPVELWPRLLRRSAYLSALQQFDDAAHDFFLHQTPLNLVSLLDANQLLHRRLPRSFALGLIRHSKNTTFTQWFNSLARKAHPAQAGHPMQRELRKVLEPARATVKSPAALTYAETATREFEVGFWNDISLLSSGRYVNKDNADVVLDPVTQQHLTHHHRDLEQLGDYLLTRHEKAIADAGMQGRAVAGELPFHWRTDFDYALFGGWQENQAGKEYERDLLVMIPGKHRGEAVIMADHYDTAYMEDIYDRSRGGSGARLAAPGADDNASATVTLLQAAPLFLKMAQADVLERDVWLLHLTGEEFPSDCMGARYMCEALVEQTLRLRTRDDRRVDLSRAKIAGVFVLDMVAHNRDDARDIFQISPGKSAGSLELAFQAHLANLIWNGSTAAWNRRAARRGTKRGERSPDGTRIPDIARHPRLDGEVRTFDDPQSSLYNTDGIIFSDAGVPVVLFMENYDLNRSGYHDSKDTMKNIDLDYGAALAAIAIETVARVATRRSETI